MAMTPTIGRNGSAVIYIGATRVDFQKITNLHATPRYFTIASSPLNEQPVEDYAPNGWDLTFSWDRYNAAGDDMATLQDNTFWSTQTLLRGTIYITINNPDGTKTRHEYANASFKFTSLGQYQADSVVNGSLAAYASQRKNV